MASDIYLACRLQELDQRIDELTQEIDALPKHVAAIESRLATHKQELAHKRAALVENAKEQRQLEGQIGDFSQKISKLQVQMNGAKTNAQFHAFQHEIQYCKDQIDQREETILDKMEQAEALEENVAKAEADLRVESVKVAADVKEAKAKIEADKKERGGQLAARAEMSARIDPVVVRAYERIRAARGSAVAAVINETCGSCHVRLRPKFLQDLRNLSHGMLTCESCGLIVYLPEAIDDGVTLEDPAGDMAAR